MSNIELKTTDPLTDNDVAEALTTENREVVCELYSLVLTLYASEGDRTKSLDAKAAALFGFVGAVVSAIFVVLGFLSDPKSTVLSSILSGVSLYLVIAVLLLFVGALLALFCAVRVKKVWRVPGDRDLFDAIHKYDGYVSSDPKNPEKSGHDYRRHLIEHFWKLYRAGQIANESKAIYLFWGQLCVFVGLVLLVVVQIVAVLAFRGEHMESNKPVSGNSQPSIPAPAAPTARPSPLTVSSQGTPVREGGRPPPLVTSSEGNSVRNSIGGRPPALSNSSRGIPTRDGSQEK